MLKGTEAKATKASSLPLQAPGQECPASRVPLATLSKSSPAPQTSPVVKSLICRRPPEAASTLSQKCCTAWWVMKPPHMSLIFHLKVWVLVLHLTFLYSWWRGSLARSLYSLDAARPSPAVASRSPASASRAKPTLIPFMPVPPLVSPDRFSGRANSIHPSGGPDRTPRVARPGDFPRPGMKG